MSLSDVVAQVSGADPFSDESTSDADGRPDPESPTTMDTPRMLPPYLHNQTLSNRSALAMTITVLVLMDWLRERL